MNDILQLFGSIGLHRWFAVEGFWFLVCTLLIFIAVFIDFSTGVKRAKAHGEPVKSKGLRRTISKLNDYLKVFYFGVVVDIALFVVFKEVYSFGVLLMCVASCSIEGYSVLENLRAVKSHAADVPKMAKNIISKMSKTDVQKLKDLL